MKEIKLNSMHVERFKGLFAFDVRFGEHTEISGRNALGKTCVYDAYLWCLFNKDSRGRVIDKVQTMDADGVADKDARTVVSVSFLIDDQQVEFRREFYQNWSKPRGKTEPVYNGNASDYFFNDVPLTLTEYNKKIQSYFDKDKFELVSNINLFASYDTAKRRAILEEIADIESLTKLIASDYPVVQQAATAWNWQPRPSASTRLSGASLPPRTAMLSVPRKTAWSPSRRSIRRRLTTTARRRCSVRVLNCGRS